MGKRGRQGVKEKRRQGERENTETERFERN
jgi:hypothetical protein